MEIKRECDYFDDVKRTLFIQIYGNGRHDSGVGKVLVLWKHNLILAKWHPSLDPVKELSRMALV